MTRARSGKSTWRTLSPKFLASPTPLSDADGRRRRQRWCRVTGTVARRFAAQSRFISRAVTRDRVEVLATEEPSCLFRSPRISSCSVLSPSPVDPRPRDQTKARVVAIPVLVWSRFESPLLLLIDLPSGRPRKDLTQTDGNRLRVAAALLLGGYTPRTWRIKFTTPNRRSLRTRTATAWRSIKRCTRSEWMKVEGQRMIFEGLTVA